MTDEELRTLVHNKMTQAARSGIGSRQVDRGEADALLKHVLGWGLGTASVAGFVSAVTRAFPEQAEFLRMSPAQLKAVGRIAPKGSKPWLQIRAARLYWRTCWQLGEKAKEKKP